MSISPRLTPDTVDFVLLSFEGPDQYSMAGGLGVRMKELGLELARQGYRTQLLFVGDPSLPARESPAENLTLHRWSQWLSAHYPGGVYDGEEAKLIDWNENLPRFVADEFDNVQGGSWDYQHWASHVGFDLEKGLAIRAIADGRATLSTISRDNYLDGRLSKISFHDDMPRAVDRLLGGLLAEDWETVGTYVPAQSSPGEQLSPRLIDLTGEKLCIPDATQGRILFANVGYSQQSSMAILASLFSRQNTDMTLMNKLRVFVDGVDGPISASGIPDAQQVRFTDPRSGYTYVARRYGEEPVYDLTCTRELKRIDQGIASRMLQHANALLAAAYWTESRTDDYGRPVLSLGSDGLPLVYDPAREAELAQYVGLLDTLRQVGAMLGGGPLGGAGGGGDEE